MRELDLEQQAEVIVDKTAQNQFTKPKNNLKNKIKCRVYNLQWTEQ